MTHGDLRFHTAFQIYYKLKGKALPEGLRDFHKALENILGGVVPGNSWVALCAFAEALPDYADKLQAICTENE